MRGGVALAATLASALALGVYALLAGPTAALAFVMLVPWLAAQDATRTLRGALGLALVFCTAFSFVVFGWFATAISGYTGTAGWVGWLALALLGPTLLQPQVLVFAVARHIARRRGATAVRLACTGAFAWVGAEWLLPKLFADSLGHGLLLARWLRQAADLAGVGGLTLVLLLVNECALAAARAFAAGGAPRERLQALVRPTGIAVALVLALASYGALRLRALDAELAGAPRVVAGFVQADISHYGSLARRVGTFDAVASILEAHLALSHQLLEAAPVELLVWPETVYPTTFGAAKSEEGAGFDRALAGFVASTRVPLVFGAFDQEGGAEFNAAIFLSPAREGQVDFETYRKATLFPLTERVPAWLDSPAMRQQMPWLGSWTPGVGARVIPLRLADGRELRIAPLICYDATTPRVAREAARAGANLIITLSNDSWFAEGGGPRLHLAVSAFRSLETRRAQLRATNTGVSAAILPDGEIVARADVHERTALAAELPVFAARPTLAVAWGDWLGPVCLGLTLVSLATTRRTR
jgi:apolipoprotein N-acyltransferase